MIKYIYLCVTFTGMMLINIGVSNSMFGDNNSVEAMLIAGFITTFIGITTRNE